MFSFLKLFYTSFSPVSPQLFGSAPFSLHITLSLHLSFSSHQSPFLRFGTPHITLQWTQNRRGRPLETHHLHQIKNHSIAHLEPCTPRLPHTMFVGGQRWDQEVITWNLFQQLSRVLEDHATHWNTRRPHLPFPLR